MWFCASVSQFVLIQIAADGVHQEGIVELRVSRTGIPFQISALADFLRTARIHPFNAPVTGVVDDLHGSERNRQILDDIDGRLAEMGLGMVPTMPCSELCPCWSTSGSSKTMFTFWLGMDDV